MVKLVDILQDHFDRKERAGQLSTTRAIVFSQLRSSVEAIVEVLRTQGGGLIKPSIFVGQATSKRSGSKGQNQKEQQEVVARLKAGTTNVLVATCIAEEGLDVGEVDLIVHYDVVTSSTRNVQRNGRTGRHRPGRVVQLYVPSEEKKIKRVKSQARAMKKTLGGKGKSKKKLTYAPADPQGSMFPKNTRPRMIEVPVDDLPKLELKDVSYKPITLALSMVGEGFYSNLITIMMRHLTISSGCWYRWPVSRRRGKVW